MKDMTPEELARFTGAQNPTTLGGDARICEETGVDEDGEKFAEPCGKPATHYSCMYWGGRKGGPNVCATHKCRCAQPTSPAPREESKP